MAKNGCLRPIPFLHPDRLARRAIQNADQLSVSRGARIVSRKPLAHSVVDTVVEGAAFCRRQRNPVPLDDVFSLGPL
jgi:hypothetical protein